MTDRIKWFPSNGSEGCMMERAFGCSRCLKDQGEHNCPLITKAMMDDEQPDEWTASDILGKDLKCSAFEPIPEPEPKSDFPKITQHPDQTSFLGADDA